MLKQIDEKIIVSVDTKLNFWGKLDYISKVLEESSKNFDDDEEKVKDKYYGELGIDLLDLSVEDHEFHQSHVENLVNEWKNFPQILFKSLLVSSYSVFETTITQVRVETEIQIPRKLKYKHLKPVGSEIENVLNFFHILHNISFDKIDCELRLLKDYIDIRNIIVHKNGSIKQEDVSVKNRVLRIVAGEKNLNLSMDDNLEFNNLFVIEYISFLKKTGNIILDSLVI